MSENLPPETEAQDETLVETLQLERIEENLFRGTSPDNAPGRIFGGQVIAQSLLAAYETVEARVCHSLHCYFIRPGDPTVPIVFEVDRSRDGGSFTTRRVVAVQHGKQIFNLADEGRARAGQALAVAPDADRDAVQGRPHLLDGQATQAAGIPELVPLRHAHRR